MSDAGIRIVLECVLVANHQTAIVSAEELVQRGDDLALADVPLAGRVNVPEHAPSRPDRTFQCTGKASLHVMESGPENHKLLVPESLLENRVQLSKVRANPTVTRL